MSENHLIKPNLLRKVAIITKAANHTIVSHAPFSFSTSSHVKTPVSSSKDKPRKVVVVASTLTPNSISGMPAHNTSNTANTPSMIFSPLLIGPISLSLARAISGASGVLVISGLYKTYKIIGINAIATKPGTTMAVNHVPHVRWILVSVALATKSTTKGLGAVAVTKIKQEMMLAW